jgi:ubiquinone/menaquinone biosynthesis C-methylase UbiE
MSDATSTVPENMKARLKESYDIIASKYNDFTRDHDAVRFTYLNKFLSHLKTNTKQNASVLELGCGAGVPVTKTLLEHSEPTIHVTGNDLSTTQLDLARQNLSEHSDRLKLVQGDMTGLDIPEQSLDGVVGFWSVIHLPREEQTDLVKNIHRWLKPGGLFLANFSQEEAPVAINKTWLKEEKGWMFWSGWGGEKSAKMVEDAGFEILVNEITNDVKDASFLWILARKKA